MDNRDKGKFGKDMPGNKTNQQQGQKKQPQQQTPGTQKGWNQNQTGNTGKNDTTDRQR